MWLVGTSWKCGPPVVSVGKANALTTIFAIWPLVVGLFGMKQGVPVVHGGLVL